MDTMNSVDMVRELRLRRWAREHYVPPARRDESWHPIVLEEMQIRDKELSAPVITFSASAALSTVGPVA